MSLEPKAEAADGYVIAIDIGGTNFRIGAVSPDGAVLRFQRISSSMFQTQGAVEVLTREISAFCAECSSFGPFRGVAIGVPSVVNKAKTRVLSTPNLKGLDDIDLKTPLEAQFGVPVFLDRDVNFLLQNDIQVLDLDPSSTILGFYVGTGLGNAVYIEGRFHAGKNGVAGELGHIPFLGFTEVCSCGNVGCAEILCSGLRLQHLLRTHFPGADINELFVEHGDDPRIVEYVRDLAIPLATEINILDPDTVLLGGGVITMKGFPQELLVASMLERCRRPFPAGNLDVRFVAHDPQSGVRGAAAFAFRAIPTIQKTPAYAGVKLSVEE